MIIKATSRPIRELAGKYAVCKRCGIQRTRNHSRPTPAVCESCRSSLSESERELWAA